MPARSGRRAIARFGEVILVRDAAESQLENLYRHVTGWLADRTDEEKERLSVVVAIGHMPRGGDFFADGARMHRELLADAAEDWLVRTLGVKPVDHWDTDGTAGRPAPAPVPGREDAI